MDGIIDKFKYLIEKAKYFQKLKDDEGFLFDELVKVPKNNIREIKIFYESGKEVEKIKKIRVEVCNLLINSNFSERTFNDLKNQINAQYETNILQSWKNYSILYVFFFNPIKDKVNKYLEDIGNYFLKQSSVPLKLKTTNFDGAQNFGEVGCWLALYNPKYKSQSEGIQYFINFYHENTTYGTYQHQDKKDINRKKYNIENLNEDLIQGIVEDIKYQSNIILEETKKEKVSMSKAQPLNQILYGPPGTGKTYHTINKALEIIDGNVPENREEAKEKFEEYRKSGQIEFVTFHQSYGYEEFVEGIKAIPAGKEGNEEGEEMIYDVVDGAFKKLINRVIDKSIFIRQYNKSQIDSINFKSYIQLEECNNTIDVGDFIFIHNLGEQTICKTFIAKSKCGNDKKVQVELLSDNSNFKFDKKLIEPYFEKLEDKNAYVDLYELINEFIPKIIIIDEINRGNISKIFGELITLIEPSKRIGAEEALHVKLPYSNESFGVPSNLYIIGTMNTADRSIALMDTALRRRFDFQEMMPRPGLLDFTVDGLHVKRMLETINKRIEYLYDRDHTIGHAYFMELKDGNKQNLETLSNIFKNKIIPLLQEYFYDDWEKIRLVLGDNQKTGENEQCQFIKIKKDYDVKKLFGNTSHEFLDDEETKIYEINDDAFGKIESYIRIYE